MPRGDGLRVRLQAIPGQTPHDVLNQALYLPAVLRGFGWSEVFSHDEYSTVSAGQFSQPASGPASARQLRTVDDVETLTIDWNPPWLVETGQDPDDVRRQLYAIGRSRRPVEMTAFLRGAEHTLLHMKVTFREISASLKEGEPDSIYYTCRIAEWRDAEVERRSASRPKNKTGGARAPGRGSKKLPTTHVLTAEDSLHSLSRRYYRSYAGARKIAEANGIHDFGMKTPLVRHPRFKVGSKIKIPKVVIKSVNTPSDAVVIEE